jgi:hypothetical protein
MANPTTNFGWVMPAAVNLVTDLPADFDVFGQAVDTDFVGLKGGTTGQVLAKASGTDLDFVWSADAAGMTNPMTTTADIIYSSSGSTPARLGIGSTDDVLTVVGGVPAWSAPAAGGGMTLLSTTSLSGATTTISGISQDYVNLYVVIYGVSNATASGNFQLDPNSDSTLSYDVYSRGATFNNGAAESINLNYFNTYQPLYTSTDNNWALTIFNYSNTSTDKGFNYFGGYRTSVNLYPTIGYGTIDTASAITALRFSNTGGNLSTGTVLIYGVK